MYYVGKSLLQQKLSGCTCVQRFARKRFYLKFKILEHILMFQAFTFIQRLLLYYQQLRFDA